MAYPKFKATVDEVIKLMGQVSGSSVQTYSEPVVKLAINRIFDYLWDKRKWDHLWGWKSYTIGTSGRITTDITGMRTYMDIAEIRDANTRMTIPLSVETEHLYVTGSAPLYRTVLPWNDPNHETRMFQFWPSGTETPVEIFQSYRPDPFEGDDDIIPMDRNLIVLGSVWFMLADDGLNPASADKYQGLFDLSYQNVVSRVNAVTIGHGAGRHNGQTVIIRQ